jgi:hypothetical protein
VQVRCPKFAVAEERVTEILSLTGISSVSFEALGGVSGAQWGELR